MVRDLSAVLACAAFLSACTVTDTPAPPFSGPSELGLSLTIQANPDTLIQNGQDQSQVVVQAFGPNGQPARDIALRAEIVVGGVNSDFGSLSKKSNLVTGADGRAVFTYTAPPAPLINTDPNSRISVAVTPVGTNYGDAFRRFVDIRLVPPGIIIGIGPTASFKITPETAIDVLTTVVFDASASKDPPNGTIASYEWDFGDGHTGTGKIARHQFEDPDIYVITLTVTDSNGLSGINGTATQTLVVDVGEEPEVTFVYSPVSPQPGDTVFFTAEGSRVSDGRREIVKYAWRFGDGGTASGKTTTHKFKEIGIYDVVLTITDDAGQQGTTNQQVNVGIVVEPPPEPEPDPTP